MLSVVFPNNAIYGMIAIQGLTPTAHGTKLLQKAYFLNRNGGWTFSEAARTLFKNIRRPGWFGAASNTRKSSELLAINMRHHFELTKCEMLMQFNITARVIFKPIFNVVLTRILFYIPSEKHFFKT